MNALTNAASASLPGPKSETRVNTRLMPFFAAHCAIGCVSCGSVCDTRTMYGERVVMTDVAAFMITIGFFASVATGATASAFGVSPNPARMSTLSRVTRLLREALGDVGRRAGRVLDHDLDLLAAEDVAVLLAGRFSCRPGSARRNRRTGPRIRR